MSVTLNQVDWTLIGEISTGQQVIDSLRLLVNNLNSGSISYTSNGSYKSFDFSLYESSLSSTNTTTYAIPVFGSLPVFPIGTYGRVFAGFYGGKINYYNNPNLYTIEEESIGTNPQLSLHGFDAIERDAGQVGYLAYCMREQATGVDNKYLRWGRPSGGDLNPRTLINVGLTGDVRLARNGLYCCVFGNLNSNQTIKVYTPQGGAFPASGSTLSIKVGADIVVPGNYLSDVRLNNTGTRLLATTQTLIYHYELVANQWVLQYTISIPLEVNGFVQGISINADGSILIASSNSVIYTYTLSGGGWVLVDQIEVSIYNSFYRAQRDISQNSLFLAAANGQTGINIYRSTITQVTYDEPLITPGQIFSFFQNTAGSASLAMLEDGLNRTPTEWSATGLPAGLSINATTGQITGTPTAEGTATATITATNPAGSSVETVVFVVQTGLPVFRGAIRATAIYAGATQAKALYRGAQKLWP